MYSKDTYVTFETNMEVEELVVFENLTEQDAFSFLNLAVVIYASHVLLVGLEKEEVLQIESSGQDPMCVGRHHCYTMKVHDAAANEPRALVICTNENRTNYVNAITFDNENIQWVLSRKELDTEFEINPSIMMITPEILRKIYDDLLPMLDSTIRRPESLMNISIKGLESISNVADFFRSITEDGMHQHHLIYEKINNLLLLEQQSHSILNSEQPKYKKMLEKSYFTLASDYYVSGYEENKINDVLLEKAFNYLQKLIILSPDHGEAAKLTSRMFILIQKSEEGKKISLADTTVLGNDVIKDLLAKSSYDVFKSIAHAMGIQYQHGFNDGKMFALSKDGLRKAGMFSPAPLTEENILSSSACNYSSPSGSSD